MSINCSSRPLPSLRRYPLSYLVAIAILLLSLLPIGAVEIAENVPFADKWTHMVMYAVFALVIGHEYWRRHTADSRCAVRLLFWAVLAPILMGGTLELLQAYATSYRSGEWLDFAANSLGVGIGFCLSLLIHYIYRWRHNDKARSR